MNQQPDPDPLLLGGLDPAQIEHAIAEKQLLKAAKKPPTELELQKEGRLREKEARISAPKGLKKAPAAPGVPAQPPEPPPGLSDAVRSALLDKIQAYRERFPGLKKRNKLTGTSTDAELKDELHFIELQLGSSGGGGDMTGMMFLAALKGLEIGVRDYWNPLGLELGGLTAVTQDNMGQFTPLLDELAIKYGAGGMHMAVELRLAVAVGTMVLTVHTANRGDTRMAESLSKMGQPVSAPSGSKDL